MSTQRTPVVPQEQDARVPEAAGFPARYARFGNFQVDLQRQELYQDGQRVKLQAQVYRALLLLLSRAGDIISREDVRKRLPHSRRWTPARSAHNFVFTASL